MTHGMEGASRGETRSGPPVERGSAAVGGRRMNVLFLGQPANLEPWFGDVVLAVGQTHRVVLFDPEAPLAHQLEDVEVVVDQGGGIGTRATVDVAATAGVKLWQVLG